MLVTATTQKAATDILNPIFVAVMPNSFYGVLLLFTVLAPAALYRGPFNMYGMGTGIAAILTSLNFLPAKARAKYESALMSGALLPTPSPLTTKPMRLSRKKKFPQLTIRKRALPKVLSAFCRT